MLTPFIFSLPGLAAEQPTPSLELLEFLGEWETDDGEWVDPEVVADIQLPTEADTSRGENNE